MANQINANIGAQIRKFREDGGYTQKEFAEMIGLTNRASLSLIENGEQAPNLEVLSNIVKVTKIDLMALLSLDIKTHIVLDTNVILNRPEILTALINLDDKDCDKIYIPKTVIDELNYQKDHGRERERRNASLCMSKIAELRGDKLLASVKPSVELESPDDMILQVARDIAKENKDDTVYMFTNDKDFKFKDISECTNLEVIGSREFSKKFLERDGYNPALSQRFFNAVFHRDVAEAKRLMERNGDLINVNAIDTRSGFTPLIKAVKNKDLEMVEYLLTVDRVNIDAVDNFKHYIPAISHAIQTHNMRIFKLLINHNVNVNEPSQSTTNYFNTPLMIAAWEGELEMAKILIENGACINQQDKKNGFTPLIKAAYKDRNDIVRYLLEKGADRTIFSFERMTALDYAYKNRNAETIKMLKGE